VGWWAYSDNEYKLHSITKEKLSANILFLFYLFFRCQEADESATSPLVKSILDILYATEVS
jgi:hypothetical protein